MGNQQSNERQKNYKIYKIKSNEVLADGNYMRFSLDDYVPYKNGNKKFIDFEGTFFSRPVAAHYYAGEYVKIDIERTRHKNSGYDFDFFSDVIKPVNGDERVVERTDSNGNIIRELLSSLGDIGKELEQRNDMRAYIVQSHRANNHAWTKQTS